MHSGFVSILGRPNAGKSTLMNQMIGAKVAIVADKPQTTRTAIQGVWTSEHAQIIFLDTPGIHKAESAIHRRMMESVRSSLSERDLLLYVIDATAGPSEADSQAASMLRHTQAPVLGILNKTDLLSRQEDVLPIIERYRTFHEFKDFLPISALRGDQVEKLRERIIEMLPEGPQYFPEDHITDQPARFLAAELVREKILRETEQEVPHSVAVLIDKWEESQGLIKIYATIMVERDGQKAIIIGSRGSMIKRIGTAAREEMEKFFNIKIYLDLHVKAEPGWREKPVFLNTLDWRTMAGDDDR
jgi:GTP-binding protein Era